MDALQYDNWKLRTPEEDRSDYNEDVDEDADEMDRGYEKFKEEEID